MEHPKERLNDPEEMKFLEELIRIARKLRHEDLPFILQNFEGLSKMDLTRK